MLDIAATDMDNDTLTYTMIPQSAGEALTYFYVYEHTGRIILRRNLPSDYNRDFDFEIRVSDDGSPSKDFIAKVKGKYHVHAYISLKLRSKVSTMCLSRYS